MIAEEPRLAAGYIRVSSNRQSKGYSPEVQEKEIRTYAEGLGFVVTRWYRDVQRGRIVERVAYQQLLADVKAGVVHAVFVFTFERAGRDSEEFGSFARVLQKRRVPFYSVKQGKDEPGIMRGVYAGLGEEEVKKLAQRVRPAKEASAREGNHCGVTPFGYKRRYEARENASRQKPGLLVPVEPAASIVRELFERAAVGWSLRDLALWMIGNPECPSPPNGGAWSLDRVRYMLHNPVYYGYVRYNTQSVGYYDRCEPGSQFVVWGKHEAIISQELYDRLQARLEASRIPAVRARLSGPLPLASGLLVCAACGGPMTIVRRVGDTDGDQYVCCNRKLGRAACVEKRYLARLAHDALLTQVDRLQGHPWDPQALERVLDADPVADTRARLQTELRDAEARMRRHAERVSKMEDDMTDEEVAAFRAAGKKLSETIKSRKEALAALPASTIGARDLRALHAQFTRVSLADQVKALVAAGNQSMVRELLAAFVASAVVTDRVPYVRASWLRVAVTWSREVQVLLDAGLLHMAPDVPVPGYPPTIQARQRARYLRYVARKRAGLVGT